MIYKALEVIQIFLADERTDERTDGGVLRGPRGLKKQNPLHGCEITEDLVLYETQLEEANDAKLVEHAGVDNNLSSILSLTLNNEHYLSDLEESFQLFCLFF